MRFALILGVLGLSACSSTTPPPVPPVAEAPAPVAEEVTDPEENKHESDRKPDPERLARYIAVAESRGSDCEDRYSAWLAWARYLTWHGHLEDVREASKQIGQAGAEMDYMAGKPEQFDRANVRRYNHILDEWNPRYSRSREAFTADFDRLHEAGHGVIACHPDYERQLAIDGLNQGKAALNDAFETYRTRYLEGVAGYQRFRERRKAAAATEE
jgi:hypothetical protein